MTSLATIRRVIAGSLCLAALACASSGGTESGREPRYEAPRLLTRTRPQLRMNTMSPSMPGTPAPLRLSIEVEVDEQGRADVKTLTVNGPGATDNRAAIELWLNEASFEPATRGGVPVRGVYKMSVEGRVTVRRVR